MKIIFRKFYAAETDNAGGTTETKQKPAENKDGKPRIESNFSPEGQDEEITTPPKARTVAAVITDISNMLQSKTNEDKYYHMVTFKPTDGTPPLKPIPVNAGFVKANNTLDDDSTALPKFVVGNGVHVTIEENIKDVTQYKQNGIVKTHDQSGQAVTNITNWTAEERESYQDEITAKELEKYAAKPGLLNAMASIKAARAAAQASK
jgi:hypothetical protein